MFFLKKFLNKKYGAPDKPEARLRYGAAAGGVGIAVNILLSAGKLIAGILSASITVIADSVNNLSDAGSSVATVIGFKMSARPADEEHPYGHARYEYLTALLLAIIIFAAGVILGKSSIEKIIANSYAEVSVRVYTFTYIILGLSVLAKIWLSFLYGEFGKAISSEALCAASADSRNDVLATSAAIAATAVRQFLGKTPVSADGIAGLAVSVFIVVSSVFLIKKTIGPIIGEKPDPALVKQITDRLLARPGVLGIHDLTIHKYGASMTYVFVHIEVAAEGNLVETHNMIDAIEHDFNKEEGMCFTAHMDPIVTDDPELNRHKEKVYSILCGLNGRLLIHDFRMTTCGEQKNIIFDVVVPYEVNLAKDEIVAALQEGYAEEKGRYTFTVTADRGAD